MPAVLAGVSASIVCLVATPTAPRRALPPSSSLSEVSLDDEETPLNRPPRAQNSRSSRSSIALLSAPRRSSSSVGFTVVSVSPSAPRYILRPELPALALRAPHRRGCQHRRNSAHDRQQTRGPRLHSLRMNTHRQRPTESPRQTTKDTSESRCRPPQRYPLLVWPHGPAY